MHCTQNKTKVWSVTSCDVFDVSGNGSNHIFGHPIKINNSTSLPPFQSSANDPEIAEISCIYEYAFSILD